MNAEAPANPMDEARRLAGLTVEELWVRYFGNGGTATATEFRSYLDDETWPERLQYDIAVSALNDRFTEIGLDHPVPYSH